MRVISVEYDLENECERSRELRKRLDVVEEALDLILKDHGQEISKATHELQLQDHAELPGFNV